MCCSPVRAKGLRPGPERTNNPRTVRETHPLAAFFDQDGTTCGKTRRRVYDMVVAREKLQVQCFTTHSPDWVMSEKNAAVQGRPQPWNPVI